MSPSELEKYLHDHIPISKAMEVGVVQVQPEAVILSAPLAPNINHRDTVFGGSASAVAILAAWSLLHTRLSGEGIASRLVIQRNTMSYELPIDGTFTAEAAIANTEAWEQFLRMLKRRGKARITITSVLNFGGKVAGRFEGEFVALGATVAQPIIPPDVAR
ncbi:thioesterase domain-containing protein [Methylobacter sp.]|uniref:thioesterase domain-containing protein n=1 Tax=Methylobacter sp. TaxID=2051955 RepID=UPI003DA300C9